MRPLISLGLASCALIVFPDVARAHAGIDHAGWTFDPVMLVPMIAAGLLYAAGVSVLWHHAGIGRGITRGEMLLYVMGWLSLAAAITSPLHGLGEHLLTLHMIEHEIIMAVSAPLMTLSRPIGAVLWGLPKGLRGLVRRSTHAPAVRLLWSWLTQLRFATLAHGSAIWIWHAPRFFDAASESEGLHRLQHWCFFLSALLFWWAVFRCRAPARAAAHLVVTMLHTSMLGALMALAPRLLYHVPSPQAPQWALTPLEDQQLAGLIMWIPAGAIYAGAALFFASRWIKESSGATRTYAPVREQVSPR